jgi:hypothetical protein
MSNAVQLTAEQKSIVANKTVSLNRPIDEVLALLTPIAQADAAGDKLRTTLGCLTPVAFIIAAILAFADVVPFHWIMAVLFALAGVALVFEYRRRKQEDVSDNLRKTAVPLLLALRDDFSGEPLHLTLDLRPSVTPEKMVGKPQKVDGKTLTTFNDAWISCEGVLADGSRLRWSVVETITMAKYWKRSSSGKQKLKTKTKKKADIDVELTLRTKTYDVGSADAGEKKARLTTSSKVKRQDADPLPPYLIIDAIAELYSQVGPAKNS